MIKKRYFEIINLIMNSNDEIAIKDISDLYGMTEILLKSVTIN